MKNTKKKKFLICKQLFGCLFEKTKASAGLLLFLDLFWKKGKDKPSIFFFFAGIALLSKQEKRSFFWSCFLFCLKLFLRAKPLKAKHVKKKPFFHALIQIGAQMIHMCITFLFVLKFDLAAIKKKSPSFCCFLSCPVNSIRRRRDRTSRRQVKGLSRFLNRTYRNKNFWTYLDSFFVETFVVVFFFYKR